MITEWLMRAVAALWGFLVSHLPALPVPSWFASVQGSLTGITSHIAGLGAWFPFGLLGIVLAAFFGILAAGFAIKLVRIVASFLTLGGGGAG